MKYVTRTLRLYCKMIYKFYFMIGILVLDYDFCDYTVAFYLHCSKSNSIFANNTVCMNSKNPTVHVLYVK